MSREEGVKDWEGKNYEGSMSSYGPLISTNTECAYFLLVPKHGNGEPSPQSDRIMERSPTENLAAEVCSALYLCITEARLD